MSWRLLREQQDVDFNASLAKDKAISAAARAKEIEEEEDLLLAIERRKSMIASLSPELEEGADNCVEISYRLSLANYTDTVRIQRRFHVGDSTDDVLNYILSHEEVPLEFMSCLKVYMSYPMKEILVGDTVGSLSGGNVKLVLIVRRK